MSTTKKKTRNSKVWKAIKYKGETYVRFTVIDLMINRGRGFTRNHIDQYDDVKEGVDYFHLYFKELQDENPFLNYQNSTMTVYIIGYTGIVKLYKSGFYQDGLLKLIKKYYKDKYENDPYFNQNADSKDKDDNTVFSKNFEEVYALYKANKITQAKAMEILHVGYKKFKDMCHVYEADRMHREENHSEHTAYEEVHQDGHKTASNNIVDIYNVTLGKDLKNLGAILSSISIGINDMLNTQNKLLEHLKDTSIVTAWHPKFHMGGMFSAEQAGDSLDESEDVIDEGDTYRYSKDKLTNTKDPI